MRKKPIFRTPPVPIGGIQKKYIIFKYENGKETFSTNYDVAQEIFELFASSPILDKANTYFLVDNRLIFLQNVTEIAFNLEERD